MARDFQGIEKGLSIYGIDGDNPAVQLLQGSAVPGGDAGDQDAAPLSSLFFRSNGEVYKKVANVGAASDWEQLGSASLDQLSWRSELVRAATGDSLSAGTIDPTGFSDLDGTLPGTSYAVGEYILGDVDGTPALFEVTAVGGATSITIAAASQPLAANDTFVVQNYLPDSPADQEGQAIIHFPDGGSAPSVKIGDLDWNFADGINFDSYAAGSGDITSADTVQTAIEKLDGNNDAQDSVLGTAQGATDLGTFSGSTIADNSSVKGALQALETAYEETDANVDDLVTLSGVPENSTDLGTFTGDIISDNNTNKGAMQELETELVDTRDNTDDLITLSGLPENSTDLGTFAGNVISDNTDVKTALSELEAAIEAESSEVGPADLTTATVVDSFLCDEFQFAEYELVAHDIANPDRVKFQKIKVMHNGSASADATSVKDVVDDKFSIGNVNVQVSASLTGSGPSQEVELTVDTNEASGIRYTIRRTSLSAL
jgi:hypothetical protein